MGGKIKISAALEVVTGMHIGGSDMYSPIGAVDKPVVSDPRSGRPIVPGSSLKGKLRTLLVRSIEGENTGEPNDDPEEVKRLFGASAPKIMRSRLQFADAFVSNEKDFSAVGLTEVKFENAINRGTGVANPRQIERVVRGVQFAVCIVYDVPDDISEAEEDMKNLAKAMKLLQIDYLGGHGTRGSGCVRFNKIAVSSPDGSVPASGVDAFDNLLKEAEGYELLSF